MAKTAYQPIRFTLGSARTGTKDLVRVVLGEDKISHFEVTDKQRVLRLGAGPFDQINIRSWRKLVRQVITTAKTHHLKGLTLELNDFSFKQLNLSPADVLEHMVIELELANYEYIPYKTTPKDGWQFIESIALVGPTNAAAKQALKRGQIVAEAVNATRDLANGPGNDIHPPALAEAAKAAARGTKAKVKALGIGEIKRLGMGGIEAVCRGSHHDPRFIIVEYNGAPSTKPIVLVGKGVTFDTGGVNIKPSEGIYGMHMDMAGGAAVIHTVIAAAKMGLKKHVVALVPAVENMPSGASYRPGDLVTTMSGQTIEVLNTDAEGRVILADALTYAERYKPQLVIDVATLTGAAMVALGHYANALFTDNDKLEGKLQELAETSGDYLWPMPLWNEYVEDIRGTFGDWANTGKGGTRMGGAIHGAVFLQQFAKNYPWAHIDIAPRMEATDGENLAKGASGTPVRLLLQYLESA